MSNDLFGSSGIGEVVVDDNSREVFADEFSADFDAIDTRATLDKLRHWRHGIARLRALCEKKDPTPGEQRAMAICAEEQMAPWYNYWRLAKTEHLHTWEGAHAYYRFEVVQPAYPSTMTREKHAAAVEAAREEIMFLGEVLRRFGGQGPRGEDVIAELGTLELPVVPATVQPLVEPAVAGYAIAQLAATPPAVIRELLGTLSDELLFGESLRSVREFQAQPQNHSAERVAEFVLDARVQYPTGPAAELLDSRHTLPLVERLLPDRSAEFQAEVATLIDDLLEDAEATAPPS